MVNGWNPRYLRVFYLLKGLLNGLPEQRLLGSFEKKPLISQEKPARQKNMHPLSTQKLHGFCKLETTDPSSIQWARKANITIGAKRNIFNQNIGFS